MRDKQLSRSERACASGQFTPRFAALAGTGNPTPATIRPRIMRQEEPGRSRDSAPGRGGSTGDQSIGIHSNGIDIIRMQALAMEWIGIQCYTAHCISMDSKRLRKAMGRRKRQTGPGSVHYNAGNVRSPGGESMPSCVACGAELEPPVRAPHTVYVKTLYRIGGQDYCRHHIVRAAAAAGVITECPASSILAGSHCLT